MSKLLRFNGAADMREAIRQAANELANEDADLSPYQQSKLITDFIHRQPKGTYRIDHVNETRWIAFVVGKTKKPHNIDMLRSAWDWMSTFHTDVLYSKYNIPAESTESKEALLEKLIGEPIARGSPIGVDTLWLEHKHYNLWYRFGKEGDDRIACCGLNIMKQLGGTRYFSLSVPKANSIGKLQSDYVVGHILQNNNTMIMIGVSLKSRMTVIGMAGPLNLYLPRLGLGELLFSENPFNDLSRKFLFEPSGINESGIVLSANKMQKQNPRILSFLNAFLSGELNPID